MSLVTSACLYVDFAPKHIHEHLLEPLPFDERGQSFKAVPDDLPGGTKGMHASVYVAGFNFVMPSDLVKHVKYVLGPNRDAVLVLDMEDRPEVYVFGPEVAVGEVPA